MDGSDRHIYVTSVPAASDDNDSRGSSISQQTGQLTDNDGGSSTGSDLGITDTSTPLPATSSGDGGTSDTTTVITPSCPAGYVFDASLDGCVPRQ
jgi:hypothetical protein